MTAENTIIDHAVDLLAERLDLDLDRVAWCAAQLGDAELVGIDIAPELQLARLLIALMGSKRPADDVLTVKSFDALPMRAAMNVRQVTGGDTTLTEIRQISPDDLLNLISNDTEASREAVESFKAEFIPSFTRAVSALVFLATDPDIAGFGLLPVSVTVRRNLSAPTATIDSFRIVDGNLMTLGYALEKEPSFPFAADGLEVAARVNGSILHDLARLLAPGLPPQDEARPLRPAA